jgi:hypothetical protein
MFAGMEFYVVNSEDHGERNTKRYLEEQIAKYGGRRVQNLMPTTTHLIAVREDFRTRSIVQQYSMNVIKYTWLLTCVDRGFLVDLEPRFMISTNKELRAYFKVNLDQFGDHYTQPVEATRLREILDGINDNWRH